ncbi:hypothetical protein EDD35_7902 [Amycolatopsis thermoflava]|uniref:Uncharacterized protein n=1 Tax=Amycolatopsis thermoflava TaxID=84480 RepID=A0A3N2G8D9_9PSEU|nr:hypothetical protein EDD35_7902 [Amycolatopsis thermoflava]
MRAAVLTPMPGVEVRTPARGCASSISSTSVATWLRCWSTVFRLSASRGRTVSAAVVPGTVTVCSSSAVQMSATSFSPMRGCVSGGDGGDLAAAADAGRSAAAGQDLQHRPVGDARPENAFEGGVDAGEQAADAVAQPGGFTGQVVVEPDQHLQLGQGLVTGVDLAQGVGQAAGGVGDDERVPGVGLGGARVEIGDAPHRQARQVGHLVPAGAGDRDRQRTNRGRLIDHDQQRPILGERVEQRPQLGFGVGQRPVVQPLPSRIQADGVMVAFADIQTEEHAITAGHAQCLSSVAGGHRSGHRWPAPTLRRDLPQGRPCPYSAVPRCHQARRHHPRIMTSTGGISHTEPGDHSSLIRNHEKGNGGRRASAPARRQAVSVCRRRIRLSSAGSLPVVAAMWLISARRVSATARRAEGRRRGLTTLLAGLSPGLMSPSSSAWR